jgi:hypothetical protein
MKRLIVNAETGTQTLIDIPADEIETPHVVVPESVLRHQARLALLAAGLLETAEAAIASGPAALKIWYEAPTFSRADPNIALVATALGLTDADVDALFIEAAKL